MFSDQDASSSSQVGGETRQREDLFEAAANYAREKKYPAECTVNMKRVIRKKAATLQLVDGEVYMKRKGGTLVKYIASRNEQLRIVKACHIDPTSGHLGIKKTYNRIAERFIWNAVLRDVQNVVSSCDECQRVKDKIVTVKPRLHPVPVHSPWHHIGIDFIGPISPTSKNGNRYILTVSDYFTKWASAFPLPTKEACGVAITLLKLFMTMGLPKIITTDQGKEFKNVLNCELMKQLNIKHHLITPYHPQANGLDERFNQTLQRMIAKYLSGKSKDTWDECIDSCVFAYNTSRHESSLYSPFQVMFGRKAILPIDLEEAGSTPSVPINQDEISEAIEVMTNTRIDILENVKENIAKAQNKQKKLYDMKHSNPCKFKIGASVLVKDFRRKKRRGGKLDSRWLGPFTIVEDYGKGFYCLKDRQKIIKRVNGAHLKIYKRPCNMPEDKLQVEQSEETSNHDSLQLNSITNETFNEDLQEVHEVSDPPLPPPLMKVSTSASDNDLQPIKKRRKQIVQKKYNEVSDPTIPPPIMEPHAETSQNSTSFLVIRRKKEHIIKDENEVCDEHSSILIKFNTAPILSAPLTESLKSENLEVFSNTSLSSLNGILSSTMVLNAGFFPPFFPDDVTCPVSPIKKQNVQISPVTDPLPNQQTVPPQSVKACVTEPVKVIAFKKRQKKIKEATKGSAIKIDLVTEKSPKKRRRVHDSSKTWVKKPLTMEDKDVLLKGKWLNDRLLDAGQELIKQKYQPKYGFQSVVLGRTLAFDVLQGKEFVQVLHNGRNHWVTVSTLGCKGNEVDVYDSMCPSLTHKLQEQIAVLIHTSNRSIVVRYRQCQMQVGSVDCGVFALAFASVLASGGHPSSHHFEQQLMRGHFEKCITSANFTPFPVKKLGRQNNKVRLLREFAIYCDCRMPEIFSKEMIKCTSCHEWYHLLTCIPRKASNIDRWICNSCNIAKMIM